MQIVVMVLSDHILPLSVEIPALQKAENRMEDSEEDVILRSGSRQHPSDIHIYKVGPIPSIKKVTNKIFRITRNNPPIRSSFSISFRTSLLVKEECPMKESGKETGKSHYSDSADLYQDHNDNVPDMCKSSRYVNRSQSVTQTEVVAVNNASTK